MKPYGREWEHKKRAEASRHIFISCVLVSCLVATILFATAVLHRAELQNINRLFEARQWLCWSPESLSRLNPVALWKYHEEHEIPRTIWAWDYTLSWLIENNHPTVKHKYVIFNHSLEDEPPREAAVQHPWLKPLLQYPLPRKTMAEAVDYLAESGARLIILDNDFPQYSADDAVLAKAIHNAATGKTAGHPVPVLMASTINHRAFTNLTQIDAPTIPAGVLDELQKLEPNVNVLEKYTGITSIALDEDQVVRRLVTRWSNGGTKTRNSLVSKALDYLEEPIPQKLPLFMDIDFAAPPNSEMIPVRPLHYLLDPAHKQRMVDPNSTDVTIPGAIVLLGDGVTDVYSTPCTNVGLNQMSGTEILAHSIDTMARNSWPIRLKGSGLWMYLMACCIVGSFAVAYCRMIVPRTRDVEARAFFEFALYALVVFGVIASGFFWFAYGGNIVPVITPALALSAGIAIAVICERENVRRDALVRELAAAAITLEAERQTHQAQMRAQQIESAAERMKADQRRRHEFVRRINHDLKAPVTVLNWTLAKLKREGLGSAKASSRVEHLERISDRLFDLVAQLVRSYEHTHQIDAAPPGSTNAVFDISEVLQACVGLEETLAEARRSRLVLDLPEYALPVEAVRLDLERALDNLIRNALLHNPPETNVEIRARLRAQHIEVMVSDDGRGIPADILPHVFDEGVTTNPSQQEHGLGLSIVKAMIERSRGSVRIESFVDEGTTVTVVLPAVSATKYGPLEPANSLETVIRERGSSHA